MKKGTKIVISVVGVIVVLAILVVGWGIGTYNKLVSADESVQTASANIDTYLQRRADLIPNLVSTVKAFAAHETEIMSAITDARAKMQSNNASLQEKLDADQEITSKVLLLVENYPQLTSNANFIALQDQLEGSENRIATARKDYNAVVKTYNTMIRTFPSSIIAGMKGFEKAETFEASESATTVPSVNFN